MALEITDTFSEPYSLATSSLPSSFSPSVVGIAGVPYLMDATDGKYRREAFEVVQQRNTGSQRDTLLLPQDVWRQQCESWHMGAGQANVDRENALPYRYKESFGIDPWTQWQISLLPKTRKIGTFTGKTWLTTWDGYAAAVNNETIYWYNSVANNAPVGSTVVNAGDPIIDIANFGAMVTTLHASFRVYETDGPSSTPVYDNQRTITNADFIAWEKDYLILGAHNKLYDATSKTAASSLIFTHPVDSFRWTSAAAGNSCIYVLGGTGKQSYVHRLNIKQDGTGLNPAIVAATLPDGEIGYTIDSYLGFVLIGTSKGVRVATENGNSGDLTLGPIIPTTVPVRCFEGQDRFVWFGNGAIESTYATTDDYFPTGTVSGLSRMDLSTSTTSILTPAYAPDIVAIDQTGKIVRSVITFNDKRMFTMDGIGVYIEDLPLMDAGWLKQGTMSFSVEDLKTGLYAQAKWLPLIGEIDLDLAYDSTGYVRTRVADSDRGNDGRCCRRDRVQGVCRTDSSC